MIEICTIGGYNAVGKNCTAIRIDDEVIILDMGIHVENYISYTEDEEIYAFDTDELVEVGAIPDISIISDWKRMVKAIIPTHAHLDHVGAIPFLSSTFDAPIICSPFTAAVIRTILRDEKITIKNQIKVLNVNSSIQISKNITIEFINMTHSTPQTVMVAIHTKHGVIIYANDFKFDKSPVLGKKPNFKRLEEIGKKGIYALLVDSTYAAYSRKTPSEAVARQMLKDVILGTNSQGKAVIVTTFSSHLARLKSIIEFGKKLNRKILLLGRSLAKYVQAGEEVGIVDFSKDIEIVKYGSKIKKKLKAIEKNRKNYFLIVTGHQGEPKATLSKMVHDTFKFRFEPEDHVIFSCTVIPTETNVKNRNKLEEALLMKKVRVFKDIHVSGHAAREDLRDLIKLLRPQYIIPAHGEKDMREALAQLAYSMDYDKRHVIMSSDGERRQLEKRSL